MDILLQSQTKLFEIENRVADQLTGAMIGNVPAAIYVEEGGADALQLLVGEQHVLNLAAPSQGIDMGMFAQQDAVLIHLAGLFGGYQRVEQLLLLFPSFSVFYLMPVFYQSFHRVLI